MLLFENKKAKLLNVLKIGINPFKRFVSTGEIKEELDIVSSRKELLENMVDTIKESRNCVLPLIGRVGAGKTHTYWTLKMKLPDYHSFYISFENIRNKFYYNIYSEYIENIGVENLRAITNEIIQKYGGQSKKFGFFNVVDIEKVRENMFNALKKKFDNKVSLIDGINAITAHQLDPYKKIEAENWLLGELMDMRDLSRLGFSKDLKDENNAYTMLKLLIEHSEEETLLFIDNFEAILSILEPSSQRKSQIYDPSWFYDEDKGQSDTLDSDNVLDVFFNLHKIDGLSLVISLNSLDKFDEILEIIEKRNRSLLITLKNPYYLPNFEEHDIYEFYQQKMNLFLRNLDFSPAFIRSLPPYYPVTKQLLKNIFYEANGNPRKIIKLLIQLFNDILYAEEDISTVLKRFKERLKN
ncbi:MAG: hypothetical protein R6U96_08875 [Promethearchaeia archaeon]